MSDGTIGIIQPIIWRVEPREQQAPVYPHGDLDSPSLAPEPQPLEESLSIVPDEPPEDSNDPWRPEEISEDVEEKLDTIEMRTMDWDGDSRRGEDDPYTAATLKVKLAKQNERPRKSDSWTDWERASGEKYKGGKQYTALPRAVDTFQSYVLEALAKSHSLPVTSNTLPYFHQAVYSDPYYSHSA